MPPATASDRVELADEATDELVRAMEEQRAQNTENFVDPIPRQRYPAGSRGTFVQAPSLHDVLAWDEDEEISKLKPLSEADRKLIAWTEAELKKEIAAVQTTDFKQLQKSNAALTREEHAAASIRDFWARQKAEELREAQRHSA